MLGAWASAASPHPSPPPRAIFENTGSELLAWSAAAPRASVEELEPRLSFAAEQANVSSESLEHGIRHLQKSLFEAASGSVEAPDGFRGDWA